jgi:two-component system, OmpR family, response regulator
MKLLIVDDNASITDMLSKYLTIKGYEVSVVNGGRNALNMIQNNQFDTVLLDLSMPDFSGIDVIESLERTGHLKNQKIVLFTASSVSNKIIDELLLKDGVKTCLKKPVKLTELVQTISV